MSFNSCFKRKLDKYQTEWQFNLSSYIKKKSPIFYYSNTIATGFFFFFFYLVLHQPLTNANYKVWFEIWFSFRDKAAILPRASELAEPFSVTPTGRFLMASFITSSNDSIHSILDRFNVKPHEISQCAENEVSTCVQPSNSDVVLHLNTNWSSHQSHQLPRGSNYCSL